MARSVSPVSTSAPIMPVLCANRMSVDSRSPIISVVAGTRPVASAIMSSRPASGLPNTASHATPVQALIAAVIDAASGSPRPPGNGQNRSGLVATNRARRWNHSASKAICSLR